MRRIFAGTGLCALLVLGNLWIPTGRSQEPVNAKGFDIKATASATGTERQSQTSLWVLEVHLKPLRLVRVKLPDPKTGALRDEVIHYLVYKVVNRDLGDTKDPADTDPTNSFDKEVTPPLFVPEITLITTDGEQKIYDDRLIPEAQKLISTRESLPSGGVLKNTVEITGAIPPLSPVGEKDKAWYGVAMWRGVDPAADFMMIKLAGFSNGYKLVRGPVPYSTLLDRVKDGKLTFSDQIWDGKSAWRAASESYNLFDDKRPAPSNPEANVWFYTTTYDRVVENEEQPMIWRKTLQIRFRRPGDEFDLREKEYRLQGDPEWIYEPDDSPEYSPPAAKAPKAAGTQKKNRS